MAHLSALALLLVVSGANSLMSYGTTAAPLPGWLLSQASLVPGLVALDAHVHPLVTRLASHQVARAGPTYPHRQATAQMGH